MWGNHSMFGGGMWWFWLLMLVAIVAVLWTLWRVRPGQDAKTEDNALAMLEKRYARGDISQDEFKQKKHDLMHHT